MPHPKMRPQPPAWMPGEEAIVHICQVDGCSKAEAISQLQEAIVAGIVRARLPDPDNQDRDVLVSLFGHALTSLFGRTQTAMKHIPPELKKKPTREMWAKANIREDGTVEFPGYGGGRYAFAVLRHDIMKWEAGRDSGQSATEMQGDPECPKAPSHAPKTRHRNIPARKSAAIWAAIDEEWPNGIPDDLEPGERDVVVQKLLETKGDWDRLFKNTKYVSFQRLIQRVIRKRAARPPS